MNHFKVFSHTKSKPLLLLAVASLILSLIFFDAYIYDVLAYHGPFSIVATGIERFNHFKLDNFFLQRYNGFAPLWRFTLYPSFSLDLPRLMFIPNALAIIFICWTIHKSTILPWYLTICAIFVFPVSLFSFRSGYQDFFVGATISSAIILLLHSIYERRIILTWISLIAALLASFTKYQGFLQSILFIIIAFLALLASNQFMKNDAKFTKNFLIAFVLGFLFISSHSIYNLHVYSNPFYPIEVGPFHGPEGNYTSAPTYVALVYPFHSLFNHFFSASELDWLFRGVVPNYGIDMARSQTQYGGLLDPVPEVGLIRTGGTYGPAYLFIFIVFISGLYQKLNLFRVSKSLDKNNFVFLMLSLYIMFASFLPQSHELRYYLAPLMLMSISSISYMYGADYKQIAIVAVIFFMSISLAINFVQPLHSTFKHGLGYAVNYPSRDLPRVQDCVGASEFNDQARRFACLLILNRN